MRDLLPSYFKENLKKNLEYLGLYKETAEEIILQISEDAIFYFITDMIPPRKVADDIIERGGYYYAGDFIRVE